MFVLTKAAGGEFYDLAGDKTELAFCPLREIDSDADLTWAVTWLEDLCSLNGLTVTAKHRNALTQALLQLRLSPSRTLTELSANVQDLDVREALQFYPDDDDNERKWQQQLAEQKDQQARSARIAELAPNAVESMFFNYRLKGDDSILPVRVFDDGRKTYIQISLTAKNREAPVLVVIGPDGKQEMVNYRVKDDMYIVDRLFDKAELILGSGKKARKVEIAREPKA